VAACLPCASRVIRSVTVVSPAPTASTGGSDEGRKAVVMPLATLYVHWTLPVRGSSFCTSYVTSGMHLTRARRARPPANPRSSHLETLVLFQSCPPSFMSYATEP
jgi:hypothetical protein